MKFTIITLSLIAILSISNSFNLRKYESMVSRREEESNDPKPVE